MRDGQFSRTALKVAATCVSLGQDPTWGPRLPEGLAEASEALILACGLHSAKTLALAKRPGLRRFYTWAERHTKGGSYVGLARRKIFIHEQVEAALEGGCRQVVVLGAGLDTLAMRLAPRMPELSFIEIDHPATSAVKARGLAVLTKAPNLSLIAAELGQTSVEAALGSCPAYDRSLATVFVAEGLLMYLDDAAIEGLFAELRALSVPGSRVVFTQLRSLAAIGGLARASLRLLGEPWLSSCDYSELPSFAARVGWELVAQGEPDDIIDLEILAAVERP